MALNTKQLIFAEEYIQCWNATEAAKRAGYSEKTAYSQGHRLLKDVEIASYVRARINEKTMQSDEILTRLSDIARGNMGDFIDAGSLSVSLLEAERKNKLFLIKKIKYITRIESGRDGQEDIQTDTVEFELYDAQKALMDLAKLRGMIVDKTKAIDWRDEAIEFIRKGEIDFKALADELGTDLATELFTAAGVPVAVGAGPEADA